jgi:hypothetical protein
MNDGAAPPTGAPDSDSFGTDDWLPAASAPTGDEALYLELDGWEGPLDLLLDLARRQKVDLRRISILDLVDQYLAYINRASELRLELAADYLVMAAGLPISSRCCSCRAIRKCSPVPRKWPCVCNCGCNGWVPCARRVRA